MATRRDFLQAIAGSSIAFSGANTQALAASDAKLPPGGAIVDGETKRLIKLLEETPREKLQHALVAEMHAGVPYRKLLEAVFLYPILWQGHHSVYLVHAAHQLTLDVPDEDRMLPLFWAVDVMKEHLTRFEKTKVAPIADGFASPEKATSEFTAAMESMERERCETAVISLCRTIGPQQVFARILPYAGRDSSFIGHIPIAIVSAGRLLNVIGWQHGETVLRWVVQQMYSRRSYALDKQPYPHNVERVQKAVGSLPKDWASRTSNEEAVLELFGSMQQGKWWRTNALIVEQLSSGRIKAGTVWDALHLFCADLMICHKQGGNRLGNRALHSNTCTNALQYAFRNLSDDSDRLLTMLQAVSFAIEFRINEVQLKHLRDIKITDLQADDTVSETEGVEAVFANLPPRIFLADQPDRSGQDKSAQLAFSLATKYPHNTSLFAAARYNMCRKLSLDAHEMKFPIAMFEDIRSVSPKWRPHLTAATVVFQQGTSSVDNPAVARGVEALGNS